MKYAITLALILMISVSVTGYKKGLVNDNKDFKYIGIDFWNHEPDALNILQNTKTNELYLEHGDGTDRHVWIRPSTGKPVMMGEELPEEGEK